MSAAHNSSEIRLQRSSDQDCGIVMHEPAVAEIPSHRRSLTGTFLVAVVGLLGVVALFETGAPERPCLHLRDVLRTVSFCPS